MAVEVGIDPRGIGADCSLHLRGQAGEIPFDKPVESQGPHVPIEPERGLAEYLGQAPGAEAALHVHLPQPVLGVDEAQREIGVLKGLGEDVGHGIGVADDLHGCPKAREPDLAAEIRERGPKPEIRAAHTEQHEHKGQRETAPQPPHHRPLRPKSR